MSQQQIDELQRQYQIADVLPLTPLQQGLLFHTGAAHGSEDLYSVQLDITVAGQLDPERLRGAVHTVIKRHPNLVARFLEDFGEPVQVMPAEPALAWQYVELDGGDPISRPRSSSSPPTNAQRSATWPTSRRSGRRWFAPRRTSTGLCSLITTSCSMAGQSHSCCKRSSPSYFGHRLPAPVLVPTVRHLVGSSRIAMPHKRRGGKVLAGFDTPTLVGPPGRLSLGRRGIESFHVSAETTQALGELARSCRTTVSTVLQAGWAQMLMWLTGQHDVAFGTAVSGRPVDLPGAESMVGLMINTVPVRASITADDHHRRFAGASCKALTLTRWSTNTLALHEIHRATGHDQLFDTVFVYENYPIDTAALRICPRWRSPASPIASTTITRCRCKLCPVTNWACVSNSIWTCSPPPASESWLTGSGACSKR